MGQTASWVERVEQIAPLTGTAGVRVPAGVTVPDSPPAEEEDEEEGSLSNICSPVPEPDANTERKSPVPLLNFSGILGFKAATGKFENSVRPCVNIKKTQAGGAEGTAEAETRPVRVAMVVSGTSRSLDVTQFLHQLRKAVDTNSTRKLEVVDRVTSAEFVLAFHFYVPAEPVLPTAKELSAFVESIREMGKSRERVLAIIHARARHRSVAGVFRAGDLSPHGGSV